MQDYYQLLGVSKTATDKEIKSAYRKKALEWHPDRNKAAGAEDMFKKINKAYETLSDSKKKQVYDQVGHQAYEQGGGRAGGYGGQQGGGQGGPFTYSYNGSPQDFGFDFGGMNDPFDIFEQFFGGQSPFGQQRKHRPLYQVRLTFDEGVKGIEKEAVIEGKSRKLKIPAGVDTGMTIRFDEFDIQVVVGKHEFFKREDQNVILEKDISLKQAILGDTIEVPTIHGSVKLKVRPGTQPNTMVRLKDQGIPFPNTSRKGDQYVVYKIKVPSKVSGKAKKLIEELDKELK